MKDVLGRPLVIGARVAVAFAWGNSGKLKVGVIEVLDDENTIRVRWEANNALSPLIKYGFPHRWIRL